MFDKVHHIAIIGKDYEKSKHFYVDLLGFRINKKKKRENKNDYKIDLSSGDIELELFIKPNSPDRISYPEALGLRHLAFKVDDVEETVKMLNIELLKEITPPGTTYRLRLPAGKAKVAAENLR